MSAPALSILDACDDPELLGRWFRDRSTWAAWFAFLAALFGLPMTPEQQEVYRRHTGREGLPGGPFGECWLACGRRSGKSFTLALIAVFLACFRSYSEFLGPGERGTVMVIAADRRQARVIMRYIRGIIVGTPLLSGMIEGQLRADGLDLNNHVTIEVGTASFRTSRGYAFVAVLADEVAFWPSDTSAEPDYEILDAIRPGMASIPGSVLLCASSPYAKRGALWDAFRTYYGNDDSGVLVWRAETRSMNPTIPASDRTKSQLYVDFLPVLNSRSVELLDLPRLTAQLCSLERRTARGGRDSIDHPPHSHDDVANCVAGVVANLCRAKIVIDDDIGGIVSIPNDGLSIGTVRRDFDIAGWLS